jgi:hypothetical protein
LCTKIGHNDSLERGFCYFKSSDGHGPSVPLVARLHGDNDRWKRFCACAPRS